MNSNSYPKLRPLSMDWIEQSGRPALLLQDRLALGARAVVVPELLVPLLALCDGTRDLSSLPAAYELQTGIRLELALVERVITQLDDALLLEGGKFAQAYRQAVESYRSLPYRLSPLAGASYPEGAGDLASMLEAYLSDAAAYRDGRPPLAGKLRGLICPHIDYDRGGPTYAQLWDRVRDALTAFDRFLILGTDHAGEAAQLTLTRQSYHTPLGILQTDLEAVDRVAAAMGSDAAFGAELNHQAEHSVELAAVWLRYLLGDRDVRVVPVLCGSFHPFTKGDGRPEGVESWRAGAEALRDLVQEEGTLVVAAADLAHMGPTFGDTQSMGLDECATLSTFDREMLRRVCQGDAEGFLDLLTLERDSRKVCGLPPIYLMLRILGGVTGETVSYSICPAPNESVVSISGVVLCDTP